MEAEKRREEGQMPVKGEGGEGVGERIFMDFKFGAKRSIKTFQASIRPNGFLI